MKQVDTVVRKFGARVAEGDELQMGWRESIASGFVSVHLATELGEEIDFTNRDVSGAVERVLMGLLEEDDDGVLHVREEDREGIADLIRFFFEQSRRMRRKGRALNRFAAQIDSSKLAEVFRSSAGKYAVEQEIDQMVQHHEFDGLRAWVEEHLEPSENGLVIRDRAEEALAEIIQQAKEVEQELANDDF